MDQAAVRIDLENGLESEDKANLPPLLVALLEKWKQEGIDWKWLDDRALVETVREAIRHATAIMGGEPTVAEAARHLEKIQVAAAMSEKTAFLTHTQQARRCYEITRRLAHECRTFFHDLKASQRLLRKS